MRATPINLGQSFSFTRPARVTSARLTGISLLLPANVPDPLFAAAFTPAGRHRGMSATARRPLCLPEARAKVTNEYRVAN
jgi:hypothetical protein